MPAPRYSGFLSRAYAAAAVGLVAALAGAPAGAEKADRTKPMVVDSDGRQAASVDLAKKVTVITGNVVMTQGTLQIKADRVEIQEPNPGHYVANALGTPERLATYRQKRDRPDEYVEAEGLRIDYDGGSDRIKFTGQARLRVLRAGKVTDEANAAVIVYDQKTEIVNFDGGAAATAATASASSPTGRVHLVFAPREAASEAASGASK